MTNKITSWQYGQAVIEEMRRLCDQSNYEVERVDEELARNSAQHRALADEKAALAKGTLLLARLVRETAADPRLELDADFAARHEADQQRLAANNARFQEINVELHALTVEHSELTAERRAAADADGRTCANGRRAAIDVGLKFITDAPAMFKEGFGNLVAGHELINQGFAKVAQARRAVEGPAVELTRLMPWTELHAKLNLQEQILDWLDLRLPELRWFRGPGSQLSQDEVDSILGRMTDAMHAIANRISVEGTR